MRPGPLARWFESLPVRGKLSVALTAQLAVLTLGSLIFLLALREQSRARSEVAHTYEAIGNIETLQVAVLEQQTGLRGFIITAREPFLDPYVSGGATFDATTQRLRRQFELDRAQSERLASIERWMSEWRTQIAEPSIAWVRDPERRSLAAEQIATGEGRRRINAVRELCAEMIAGERRLLGERAARLERLEWTIVGLIVFLLLVGWATGARMVAALNRQLSRPLARLATLIPELGRDANLDVPYRERKDEIGALAGAFERLREVSRAQQEREWIAEQASQLITALQSARSEPEFGDTLLSRLCTSMDAGYALAYRWNADVAALEWCAAYGLPDASATRRRFRLGEGLVGQCMVERRVFELSPVPEGYLRVVSGLGAALPHALLFVPLTARGETVAVLELGLMRAVEPAHRQLLDQVAVTSALSWDALSRALQTQRLLQQSEAQAEELRAQQEAMQVQQDQVRTANEALRARGELLEEQGRRLKASDEELRAQTEELKVTNAMLEEKTAALRQRQAELEASRAELERKAEDLQKASRYKSEFLANMSHELRTPLNSMLILSKLLADNPDGNLDAEQVESARIMHDSGQSLLTLINDILDLSKVEAGKMALVFEDVNLEGCLSALYSRFQPLAGERGLRFEHRLAPGLPTTLYTDGARLSQVLSNLLSNAFKFTHDGGIELSAEPDPKGVLFKVRDTGIGIPADRLSLVFQAFEQADSGTSRRYGGTGLGLSIVRGMTALLGGEVRVQSQEGKGSEFSILIPTRHASQGAGAAVSATVEQHAQAEGASIMLRPLQADAPSGPPALLVVEDDVALAKILADIASKRGLEVLVAHDGQQALRLARERQLSGVLLDLGLPDISGWRVLEQLKAQAHTAQVPVHVISGSEEGERSLDLGAVGFLRKPVTRESVLQALQAVGDADRPVAVRRLLVVDDDPVSRLSVRRLLSQEGAEIVDVADGAAAMQALQTQRFDGLILDLSLPDISGFDLLDRVAEVSELPPVVIYSARELTAEEHLRLRAYTGSIVIKGARAPERLFDEVALFLHALKRGPGSTPAPAAQPPTSPPGAIGSAATSPSAAEFEGKVVLVVDDDMRNVFALSKALRARGLSVVMAQDGQKALAQLEARTDINLVLMDIMMPGMDGYETIRRIRAQPKWSQLPIIAVTAKAMKGDREKCLEAGANDYCSKPIDMEQLLSLMHVWV